MLAKGVLGATHGVLAEVVRGELVSLAQKLAILCRKAVSLMCSSAANYDVALCVCRAEGFAFVRDGLAVPGSGLLLVMRSCLDVQIL